MEFDQINKIDIRHIADTEVCVFCFKIRESCGNEFTSVYNENLKIVDAVSRFAMVLGRFASKYTDNNKISNYQTNVSENCSSWHACCKSCRQIVDAFCNDYYQLKCLEMKMEWKLQRLVNLMDLAGRVPSRLVKLRKVLGSKSSASSKFANSIIHKSVQSLQQYRQEILKKCEKRLSMAQPRVLLKRVCKNEHQSEQELPGIDNKIKCETVDNEFTIISENNLLDDLQIQVKMEHVPTEESSCNERHSKCGMDHDKMAMPFGDVNDSSDDDNYSNHSDGETNVKVNDGQFVQCAKCTKSFPTKKRLNSHIQHVHSVHKCKQCGKQFKTRFRLSQHFISDHNHQPPPPKWECKTCGEKFRRKFELDHHAVSVHKLGKPLPCDKCDKTFLTERRLRVHIRRVHVEGTHRCSECNQVFRTREILQKHVKSHTMPVSARKSSRDNNAKQYAGKYLVHSKEKEKRFECKECGKFWSNRSVLYKHLLCHENGEQIICQFCGSTYAHILTLRQHVRKKHRDQLC